MARKKAKKEKEQLDFEKIHNSFETNLESLEAFLKNVSPIAEKHDRVLDKRMGKFARQILKIVGVRKIKGEKVKQEQILEKMTDEKLKRIAALATDMPRLTTSQTELLHRSSFIMLISYFDFLLSDLINYFYRKYPENLPGKELSLTLSELKLSGSFDAAIDFIINKEVDRVLYKSLEEQKNYLKNTMDISTKDSTIHWNRLVEAMERRHIVVHNDCRINRRYLSKVDLSQVPEKAKDLKEGARVQITKNYLNDVFEEIYISGLALLHVCWRKWEKDAPNKADMRLNSDIYNALKKENWRVAERLGLFSKECKVADQTLRLYLDLNYCQSLKWQDKKAELEKELKKLNVSTLSPMYALAVYALKSDADNFYKNVKNAIIVDKMEETYFMDWPIFREFREDPGYEEKIKTAFASTSEQG